MSDVYQPEQIASLKADAMKYQAIKRGILNDLCPDQTEQIERRFEGYLDTVDEKQKEQLEAFLMCAKLDKANDESNVQRIKKFFEEVQCSPTKNTPDMCLGLASACLVIGNTKFAAEAIWAAASTALKYFANNLKMEAPIGGPIQFHSHYQLKTFVSDVLEKLPTMCVAFSKAEGCHSSGFYNHALKAPVLRGYIPPVKAFAKELADMSGWSAEKLANTIGEKGLEVLQTFRPVVSKKDVKALPTFRHGPSKKKEDRSQSWR